MRSAIQSAASSSASHRAYTRRQLRLELGQPRVGLSDRRAVALVKRRVGHRLVQLLNLCLERLDARGQRFQLAPLFEAQLLGFLAPLDAAAVDAASLSFASTAS